MKKMLLLVVVSIFTGILLSSQTIYDLLPQFMEKSGSDFVFFSLKDGTFSPSVDQEINRVYQQTVSSQSGERSSNREERIRLETLLIEKISDRFMGSFLGQHKLDANIIEVNKFGSDKLIVEINIVSDNRIFKRTIAGKNGVAYSPVIDSLVLNFLQPHLQDWCVVAIFLSINGVPIDRYLRQVLGEEAEFYPEIMTSPVSSELILNRYVFMRL